MDFVLRNKIQNDDPRTTAQTAESFLMKLGPSARTRSPCQQAYGLAAITERQNKQPWPAILAGLRIAHHRATAVIDLCLFCWCGEDDAHLLPDVAVRPPFFSQIGIGSLGGVPETTRQRVTQMLPHRCVTVLNTFVRDLRGSVRLTADWRSRLRLSIDFALSRFIGLVPRGQRNRLREIRLRGDIKIRYRLNKGDLHSIREIWLEQAYRLPFDVLPGVLLDLGANIGMTSVWLSKRFSFTQVIAVEPDPNNAALVRQNLELNGISGHVLEAAIGPREKAARFEFSELSNLGRLSENGSLVPMISVDTIVKKFAVTRFALVKIDVEGGEQDLFEGSTAWLARTEAIVIEFHPATVDYLRLTRLVSSHGFTYIPAHSFFADNMDCFTRLK